RRGPGGEIVTAIRATDVHGPFGSQTRVRLALVRRVERWRLRRAHRQHGRRPHHESSSGPGWSAMAVDHPVLRKSSADARLQGDARGRDGGVHEELATGVADGKS